MKNQFRKKAHVMKAVLIISISIYFGFSFITFSKASVILEGVTLTGGTINADSSASAVANSKSTDLDSDDAVSVAHNDALEPTDEFTVSAWIKQDGAFGAAAVIFMKQDWSASIGYALYVGTGTRIRWRVYDGSKHEIAGSVLSSDTWYHVAGVWDGTNMTLYLNGAVDAGPTAQAAFSAAPGQSLLIGRSSDAAANYWDGWIDEVSFWNVGMTQAEVNELIFSGEPADLTAHSRYADIVSWWRFEDDLTDEMGAHDGAAVSDPAYDTDLPSI